MLELRSIELYKWLILHFYIALGHQIWRQVKGIPMDFLQFPLLCNFYLTMYKVRFIQRLAKLRQHNFMNKFAHAFRYIDNLCWLNVTTTVEFLNNIQAHSKDNSFGSTSCKSWKLKQKWAPLIQKLILEGYWPTLQTYILRWI